MIWGLGRLSEWDPFGEFERMERQMSRMRRDMDRLFSRPQGTAEFPPVNIWRNEHDIMVTTEIPGAEPKDMDISVSGKVLTIRGSRAAVETGEVESYERRERGSGNFSRNIELPFTVDAGKVEARFSKGVLYITLPRAEVEKQKKITVQSA